MCMGPEAFAVMPCTCRNLRRQAGIDKPSNIAVEQTAGSRSLAAAAHRERSAHKEGGMGIEQAQAEGDAAIKRLLGESDLPFGEIGPRPTDAWI